jgi:hypothetical protein
MKPSAQTPRETWRRSVTRRATGKRPRRWVLSIAAAAGTGTVLCTHKSAPPVLTVALILLSTFASLELSRREARAPGTPLPIVATIGALFTLAVVRPPRFATDIWSYAIIGRTVVAHHLNPYRVAPAVLLSDPMLHFVHPTWRTGTTPYGPLFVAHAAFVALFAGTHPLLYRLAFQLTAATAIGIGLWLIWRETRSTAALALVGLNPVVVGSIVNAGHNDALVALGLLGVVLLLARGRTATAGWVLAMTVLLKISIGFAALPLAVWTVWRYGRRGFFALFAPTLIVAGSVTLLVPGALKSMTAANRGVVTRLAIWNIAQRVSWLGLWKQPSVHFTTAGLGAAFAITVLGAYVGCRQPDAGRGAVIGAAGWLIGTAYVLAWYTVLGFLTAALRPTERLARWFAVQGGLITAAFLIPRADLSKHPALGHIVWFWIPLALVAGFVWAVAPLVAEAFRSRGGRRTPSKNREPDRAPRIPSRDERSAPEMLCE